MAEYTQLTKEEIEEIAAGYGLAVSSYNSIAGGAENSSFKLETVSGPIMLTLFETKSAEKVVPLANLLKYLEEQAFPSDRMRSLSKGGFISEHQGKAVLLKRYFDGEVVDKLSLEMIGELGQTIAQLHAIPAPDFLANELAFGIERIRQGLGRVADQDFRQWLEARCASIEARLGNDLPIGMVHADLFNDNMLFKEGKFQAMIDFEDASKTILVYDIGMAIVGTCLQGTNVDWEKASALVQGYESVRRLEAQERSALQASIEYGALSTAYWRYWKYNIEQPTPERTEKHLEMKAVADGVSALSKDQLLVQFD